MTSRKFHADAWVDRLAATLPVLENVQKSYLEAHWSHNPRTRRIVNGIDVTPFPLDDLRMIYQDARYSRRFGKEDQYAPLCKALDSVRYALLSHPVLERVAVTSRPIGENDFWIQVLGSGLSISAGHLIAGLMARTAELPGGDFRTAVRELNALLSPVGDEEATCVLGPLDEGCDLMLFYGLTVTERIDIREDMSILPYEEVRRFVDDTFVEELTPLGAGIHGWRSVGAVAKPFRWRPVFRREGSINEPASSPPGPFFSDAAALLDLLAVAHTTPVVPFAKQHGCIDQSAGRLLGMKGQGPGIHGNRPVQGFDGFAKCPVLSADALEDAREVFENRKSDRYRNLVSAIRRLAQALARDERFALHDKILDVSIALEGMYSLPERRITATLAQRVSNFLGTDADSRDQIDKSVRMFYDMRSKIAHSRPTGVTPSMNDNAFATGFDLARQTLFKLLREGAPDSWAN